MSEQRSPVPVAYSGQDIDGQHYLALRKADRDVTLTLCRNNEEAEAAVAEVNAAISSAADLLEMLKAAVPYVEAFHSLLTEKDTRRTVMKVIKGMESAIAKATGDQRQ